MAFMGLSSIHLFFKHVHPWSCPCSPGLLGTAPGQRLLRVTCEATGCEGVIVRQGDRKLSITAERASGDSSRWREIRDMNGLEGKNCRIGDCLRLPGMPDL